MIFEGACDKMAGMKGRWYHIAVALVSWALVCIADAAPQHAVTAKASVTAYAPGKTFDIAMQADMPAPWHAYYRNPGCAGIGMSAQLTAPEGFTVEGPYWQPPMLHVSAISTAYAYEKAVVVWRITPQEDAPAEASFSMRSFAQLCSDSGCLPPQGAVCTLELMRADAAQPNPAWQGEERLVETLGDVTLTNVHALRTPQGAVLYFRKQGDADGAQFFSDDNAVAPSAPQELSPQSGGYALSLVANDGKQMMYPLQPSAQGGMKRLVGIMSFADGSHARVDVPVEDADVWVTPDGLWSVLMGLFVGGLVLNLMPCVFPVIGLKIMGFVSLSGGSRSRVVWHSLAFTLGILISFWLLGLALIAISNSEALYAAEWHEWPHILLGDAGSTDRTWAVWMSNEWVVYFFLLALLALGLGMFGIYEIGARATGLGAELQSKGGLIGSFFQGCFITLIATPCSAPFLGSAIAVAMAYPAVWMLVGLTAMALGLALPYILLGIFPALVHLLPKPGAWMESLKQGLSFFLFAAAAWMFDVYLSFLDASGRADDVKWVLISLVGFCAAFWIYGRWCALYRSRTSRVLGLLAALALGALAVWGSMPRDASADGAPEWEEWSEQAMNDALEHGTPVYVDFTAKWCPTCQFNKATAYSDRVYELLEEKGVLLMRADKTLPNEAIDAELRRLKRTAVPTNALYLPGKSPLITTELLTEDYLYDFLKEALEK